MKILFIGNFDVSYSTESHHLWTYKKLGHDVITIQENKCTSQEIISKLDGVDLLVWTHTHGWGPKDMDKVFDECKKRNIPTAGYHLDLWMGIERQKDLETDPYWKIDYFFCTDKLMVDYLNSRSDMPRSFYLPAGVVEKECYIGNKRKEFEYDVVFTGSRGYHKEWPYRAKLIGFLEDTYGDRFAHFGGDGKRVVRGGELNDLYASAKVVVGDTLCKDFDYPYYYSDRLFEVTGRGGCLVFPYIKGLEDNFKVQDPTDMEVVDYTFDDFEELKSSIDYLIRHDTAREIIKKRGFERTKRDHTYTKRLESMLKTIKLNEE